MAITTVDGIINGMLPSESFLKSTGTMEAAAVFASQWLSDGRPGTATAYDSALAGQALTSPVTGQIPFPSTVAGTNIYLARFTGNSNYVGQLLLCDRLWQNGNISETTTGGQTVNSVAFPARDRNGTINGEDIGIAIEVSAATGGSAVTNTTLTYTNSGDTGSRTATMPSFPASAAKGTFVPFVLAAGDKGVKSVQTLTLGTTYTSGTIHLVAYRIIASIEISMVNVGASIDALTGGFPRLYNDSVPFLVFMPNAVTAAILMGQIFWAQG